MPKPPFFATILIAMAMAGGVFAQNERPLSLDEALHLAREQGYQMEIARGKVGEARGENTAAWKGFLPQVTLEEQYIDSDDPVAVFGMKLRQGVFAASDFDIAALNSPESFENYATQVQVNLPLLNLDAIWGKLAAGKMLAAQKAGLQRTGEQVDLMVRALYFGLTLAREQVRTYQDALQSVSQFRDNARLAFEQGIINRADYLAMEVRVLELQQGLLEAQNNLAGVNENLRLVMAIEDEVNFLPTDSLSLPAAPETAGITLNEERPDLLAARYKKQAAGYANWAAKGSWLPRLNGFGNWQWHGAEAFASDSENRTLGLSLSWNIFDGLGNLGRNMQSSARYNMAKTAFEMTRQQAHNELAAAQRKVAVSRQQIELGQTAVVQARESVRLTEQRFRQGLENTADLLAREASLTRARLTYLKALYDYNIALHELNFASGQNAFAAQNNDKGDR